jgi:riboflavin kinase/FMN adenylyltransferase
LRAQAQAAGGPAVALTFDPHPLQLLRPQEFQPVLTTIADRAELLQAAGADHVLVVGTTSEMLRLSPEAFFEQVVRGRLNARVLVEGTDFHFGRNRVGNIESLTSLCREAGLGLVVVPPFLYDGQVVSSSRVRAALVRGDPRAAERLLGRPHRLRGIVGAGQHRGQALGFPTANLERVATLLPAEGVYAVRVLWEGSVWPGAANLGPNPTFHEQVRKLEVHLIGFHGDLYGQELDVEFLERLRATRPFASVAELVEQLRRDVEQARRVTT